MTDQNTTPVVHKFTQIVTGVMGAEGPVFDRKGRWFVVSPNDGAILQIDIESGSTREFANTGGCPAGLQVDLHNRIWVADMKLGILSVTEDGCVEVVVGEHEAQPMRGCNDCAFDDYGNLYFSAPAGSNDQTRTGEVFCLTSDGTVVLLDGGYAFSNGVAVAQGSQLLIVAETYTKTLWAYDLLGPGKVANKRVFARLSGDHHGGPDGLDYDAQGNLLAANWGGSCVEVFDPSGNCIDKIVTPFKSPSNLHFGGSDGQTLIVTEHTNHAVWSTYWPYSGLIR